MLKEPLLAFLKPILVLTLFALTLSYRSVWEAAGHDYDTVVWAVKSKIKQIGDVLHFFAQVGQYPKKKFFYFIIYIGFY